MNRQAFYRKEKGFPQQGPDLKAFIIENRLLRKVRRELEGKVMRPLELALGEFTHEILFQMENKIQKMDQEELRSAEAVYDTNGIVALATHLWEEQRRAEK